MTKYRANIYASGAMPARGGFLIVDNSMNGTWLNGKRLTRGQEEKLPARPNHRRSRILTLHFEAKG